MRGFCKSAYEVGGGPQGRVGCVGGVGKPSEHQAAELRMLGSLSLCSCCNPRLLCCPPAGVPRGSVRGCAGPSHWEGRQRQGLPRHAGPAEGGCQGVLTWHGRQALPVSFLHVLATAAARRASCVISSQLLAGLPSLPCLPGFPARLACVPADPGLLGGWHRARALSCGAARVDGESC